jgi:hypothetical protein
MEYRKIELVMRQPLTSEQQNALIAQYKGFCELTVDTMREQAKKIRNVPFIPSWGKQTASRMEGLVAPLDGGKTPLGNMFSIEFDEEKPLEYVFIYPYGASLVGISQIAEMLKLKGQRMSSAKYAENEEKHFLGFCKEAGISDLLLSYKASMIELE